MLKELRKKYNLEKIVQEEKDGTNNLESREFNHLVDIFIFKECPHPSTPWNGKEKNFNCDYCGMEFWKYWDHDLNEYKYSGKVKAPEYKNDNCDRYLHTISSIIHNYEKANSDWDEDCRDFLKLFNHIIDKGLQITTGISKEKIYECYIIFFHKGIYKACGFESEFLGRALAFAYFEYILEKRKIKQNKDKKHVK